MISGNSKRNFGSILIIWCIHL